MISFFKSKKKPGGQGPATVFGKLVHPGWIDDLIHDRNPETYDGNDFLILDVSSLRRYKKKHIPGAVHVDTNEVESKPLWNVVPTEKLTEFCLKKGITKDTLVILYSDNPMASARVAVILMYAGVADVRLLNGGFLTWKTAGFKTQKAFVEPREVSCFGAPIPVNPKYIIGTKETKAYLNRRNSRVVSIRSLKEQTGKKSGYRYIKARGRIKGDVWGHGGSNSHDMGDFRNPDQTMRSPVEIERMWQAEGITKDRHIVFYCGTGWRASEAFFYAHSIGFRHISVYDGGWMEWSSDKLNPVARGGIVRNETIY